MADLRSIQILLAIRWSSPVRVRGEGGCFAYVWEMEVRRQQEASGSFSAKTVLDDGSKGVREARATFKHASRRDEDEERAMML